MVLIGPWSSFPMMLKLPGVTLCPLCWMCTWISDGSLGALCTFVLLITCDFPTLVAVDDSTFPVLGA